MYSQCIALIRFCLLLPFGVSTDTPEKCMKPMTKLDLGANLDKGQLQSNPKQITTVHHTSDCSNGRFFAFDTHRGEPFCCFHASKSVQWISMYTLTKVETWCFTAKCQTYYATTTFLSDGKSGLSVVHPFRLGVEVGGLFHSSRNALMASEVKQCLFPPGLQSALVSQPNAKRITQQQPFCQMANRACLWYTLFANTLLQLQFALRGFCCGSC